MKWRNDYEQQYYIPESYLTLMGGFQAIFRGKTIN